MKRYCLAVAILIPLLAACADNPTGAQPVAATQNGHTQVGHAEGHAEVGHATHDSDLTDSPIHSSDDHGHSEHAAHDSGHVSQRHGHSRQTGGHAARDHSEAAHGHARDGHAGDGHAGDGHAGDGHAHTEALHGRHGEDGGKHDKSANGHHGENGHKHAEGQHDPHGEKGHVHGKGGQTHGKEPRVDSAGVAIGDMVPDFEVTLDGKRWKLSELRKNKDVTPDGTLVFTFWCSFCHSCRHVENSLDKLARAYRGKAGVIALDASAGETAEEVAAFAKKKELTFPIALSGDGSAADRFGVNRTTTTVVIDRAGKLRYLGQFAGRGHPYAEDALKAVLAGQEVEVQRTRPKG